MKGGQMKRIGNPYIGWSPNLERSVIYTRPTLVPSVVAFVDILGYRDLILEDQQTGEENEFLNELHNALSEAAALINPKKRELLHKFSKKDSYAVRAFTDNVVIGYPIAGKGDGEVELERIFSDLSYFQMMMTLHGFFVRGAISIGDLYMDDIVIYGAGLIEAYEGERKLARDPRIILTQSARDAVKKHLKYYGDAEKAPKVNYLYKDSDGQWFLNYLDIIMPETDVIYEEKIQSHKERIVQKLNAYPNKPVIWSKYSWAANYHNFFCSQHPAISHNSIDLEAHRLTPTLISR
jgi:hypothetical protein